MKIKKHLNFTTLRKIVSDNVRIWSDSRREDRTIHSLHDAVLSGLSCMYFLEPSLLQFQQELQDIKHQNNLCTLFGIKSIPSNAKHLYKKFEIWSGYFLFYVFKNEYLEHNPYVPSGLSKNFFIFSGPVSAVSGFTTYPEMPNAVHSSIIFWSATDVNITIGISLSISRIFCNAS